ncbi:MAG: glycosyltransferase [Planctomycetota bacterium]|nr:glycosyltransferase [Planctomycetota bacterium]
MSATSPQQPRRIAYLVNLYPKTSHAWMRREIAAMAAAGFAVERFSVRRVDEPLVDPDDVAEAKKTRVLLDGGALAALPRALLAVLFVAVTRPVRLLKAAALAFHVRVGHPKGLLFQLFYLAEACLFLRMLAGRDVAHVHAHFGTNAASVAMLTNALGGPGYSFTFHGPEIFEHLSHRGLRQKLHRAEFAVAISHHGHSALKRWSDPSHWDKLHLIRCGVDARFLDEPATPPPAAHRLLCVARMSPVKGHLVLLEAAAEVIQGGADLRLAFVGDGDFAVTVRSAAARLGLEERIEWLGWLDGEQVKQQILRSKAMVLPSFDEGLPVVCMESLALGRPVISTYIAGIPELIETGETGWVVPAGSAPHLADALRACVAASPEELRRLGDNGRARVRAEHDAEVEANKLARLFLDRARA